MITRLRGEGYPPSCRFGADLRIWAAISDRDRGPKKLHAKDNFRADRGANRSFLSYNPLVPCTTRVKPPSATKHRLVAASHNTLDLAFEGVLTSNQNPSEIRFQIWTQGAKSTQPTRRRIEAIFVTGISARDQADPRPDLESGPARARKTSFSHLKIPKRKAAARLTATPH